MPNFDIESFKSNFEGGARSYLFYFRPNFPSGVSVTSTDKVTYLVRTATLPATTLEEGIANWQGLDLKFATKSTFEDMTITFSVDIEAKVRKVWEDWMRLIHDPVTNRFGRLGDYLADQRLQLLDYDGTVVMEYILHMAWPKTVGSVTLDYASTEVAQFDVTLSYGYHTVVYNKSSSGPSVSVSVNL